MLAPTLAHSASPIYDVRHVDLQRLPTAGGTDHASAHYRGPVFDAEHYRQVAVYLDRILRGAFAPAGCRSRRSEARYFPQMWVKPRKVNVVPCASGWVVPVDSVLRKSTKRVSSRRLYSGGGLIRLRTYRAKRTRAKPIGIALAFLGPMQQFALR
jgi:hypothetical protein